MPPHPLAWVLKQLVGQRVAVLGPKGAGKTTFYDCLVTGQYPIDRKETHFPTKRPRGRSPDHHILFRTGLDQSGDAEMIGDWKSEFSRCQAVFYLFDAFKLRTKLEYGDRLRRDSREIKNWSIKSKPIMLIGTHADNDPSYLALGARSYRDEIADLDAMLAFQRRVGAKAVAVGPMTNEKEAAALFRSVWRA